jgi:glycine/D-amino acid oxidase-like deaminating enzyme
VVGAGIVGSAIADRLQALGSAVTIFEADIPAGGCTSGAMGGLMVLDDSPAQLALTSRGVGLWRQEDLSPRCEREPRGTMWLATDQEEVDELRAKAGRYSRIGLVAELLDPDQLRQWEPAVRQGMAGALRVPGDQTLYQIGAARFLLDRALSRGAVLKREAVRALEPGGVRTDQGAYRADAVVLAAGLGITGLLPELPITPRKGLLAITDRIPGMINHQLIEMGYLKSAHGREATSVAFTVQARATGQLLIGSSREFAGQDPGVNRELLRRMLRRAVWFLPDLDRAPVVRAWAGFRPCGPSNLPMIGPCPGREGLFVAGCHEGYGSGTALSTAELMAHHVLGAPTVLDPAPFLPKIGEFSHV